jgi:hypothetical protein
MSALFFVFDLRRFPRNVLESSTMPWPDIFLTNLSTLSVDEKEPRYKQPLKVKVADLITRAEAVKELARQSRDQAGGQSAAGGVKRLNDGGAAHVDPPGKRCVVAGSGTNVARWLCDPLLV